MDVRIRDEERRCQGGTARRCPEGTRWRRPYCDQDCALTRSEDHLPAANANHKPIRNRQPTPSIEPLSCRVTAEFASAVQRSPEPLRVGEASVLVTATSGGGPLSSGAPPARRPKPRFLYRSQLVRSYRSASCGRAHSRLAQTSRLSRRPVLVLATVATRKRRAWRRTRSLAPAAPRPAATCELRERD